MSGQCLLSSERIADNVSIGESTITIYFYAIQTSSQNELWQLFT
jgi:hypothetical protein